MTWVFIAITSRRRWAEESGWSAWPSCCSMCLLPFIGCCCMPRRRGWSALEDDEGELNAGSCCWCCCTSRDLDDNEEEDDGQLAIRLPGHHPRLQGPRGVSCCIGCRACRDIKRCFRCTFCCIDSSLCGIFTVTLMMAGFAIAFGAMWGACITLEDIGTDTCLLLQANNASLEDMEGESAKAMALQTCRMIEDHECADMNIALYLALSLGGGIASYVAQFHLLVSLQYHFDRSMQKSRELGLARLEQFELGDEDD